MSAESLVVSTHRDGATAVIELDGEFDLHGASQLTSTVDRLLDRRPSVIEIDASNLTFVDSAGLRALLVAREQTSERDVGLRISKRSEPLDRLMGMTGLHEMLGAD